MTHICGNTECNPSNIRLYMKPSVNEINDGRMTDYINFRYYVQIRKKTRSSNIVLNQSFLLLLTAALWCFIPLFWTRLTKSARFNYVRYLTFPHVLL